MWESLRRKPTTRRGAWLGLIVYAGTLLATAAQVILVRGIRETYVWIYGIILCVVGIADMVKCLRQTDGKAQTPSPQKPSV